LGQLRESFPNSNPQEAQLLNPIKTSVIQGMQIAKFNKKDAIKAGYESGLTGDPEVV